MCLPWTACGWGFVSDIWEPIFKLTDLEHTYIRVHVCYCFCWLSRTIFPSASHHCCLWAHLYRSLFFPWEGPVARVLGVSLKSCFEFATERSPYLYHLFGHGSSWFLDHLQIWTPRFGVDLEIFFLRRTFYPPTQKHTNTFCLCLLVDRCFS